MRRALVFGSNGQLGTELMRATWPASYEPVVAPLETFDFARPETLAAHVEAAQPSVIVNAAAYTAVDKAESEADLAHRINARAPEALARVAEQLDIPLLHVSTDYVFSGELEGRDYVEDDLVGPINVYGETKELGESLIRAACRRHVIVRTSWVYSSFGANFVKTMLRVGRERDELSVVNDQVGRPTHAGELAAVLLSILSALSNGADSYGTYHFASDTAMSWHAFAESIFAAAKRYGVRAPRVLPIPTSAYPTPARRPRNSKLDGARLLSTFGIRQHDFGRALDRCVNELLGDQA